MCDGKQDPSSVTEKNNGKHRGRCDVMIVNSLVRYKLKLKGKTGTKTKTETGTITEIGTKTETKTKTKTKTETKTCLLYTSDAADE